MNRKATPILLLAMVAMIVLAVATEWPRSSASTVATRAGAPSARVLNVNQGDLLRIRVKRDYWNSYTLARSPEGAWRLTDPSDEPASESAVRTLLATVESLPAVSIIDLPSDDSERHRQYGLWSPSLELTVSTSEGDQTVTFGTQTADNKGVYCARIGQDKVYVTTPEAVQVLSQDLNVYRSGKTSP